jgi:Tol biopolymer transport system component
MLRLAELAARECDGKNAFSVPVLIAAKRQLQARSQNEGIWKLRWNPPNFAGHRRILLCQFPLFLPHLMQLQTLSPSTRYFDEPAVSPDGQNLATTVRAANDDIWLLNRSRSVLTRFTFAGGDNQTPVWSGDGSHVIYSRSNRTRNLFWRPVNGGAEEHLTSGDTVQLSDSTTPDGKLLAFTQWTGANSDIYVLPFDGAHTARPLIATRFNEQEGMFSPDGKWQVLVSNESGRATAAMFPSEKHFSRGLAHAPETMRARRCPRATAPRKATATCGVFSIDVPTPRSRPKEASSRSCIAAWCRA